MDGTEIARISGKYSTAFILTYQLTGQNIAGNYSTFKMRVYGYYGGGTSTGSSYGTIWISGTEYGIGAYRLYPGYTLLAQKDITVYHNNDGSFPYTTQAFAINSYHANGEASGALSAPSIPRQANITRCDDFNSNGNPYMEFSNPGGFKLNLRLEFGGTFISRNNYYGSGGYTFQLTESERNLLYSKCPNSNLLTVRYVVATCIGGGNETHYSYIDRTMTVVNSNPEFNYFEFEDVDEKTTLLTGNPNYIIKGYSTVFISIPVANKATAKNAATMSRYRGKIGESPVEIPYSDSAKVGGRIPRASSSTITCYAIDSRDNSTAVEKQASRFIDYNPVTKGNVAISRANGVSESVTLKINGTYHAVNFGAVNNSIKKAQYRYKTTSSSEWEDYQNLEVLYSEGNFSFNGLIKSKEEGFGFNINNSYQFEIIIEDELSSVTFTANLGSGIPNIALAKNGVGIMGKYDGEEGGLLQVGGKDILKKNVMSITCSRHYQNFASWEPQKITSMGIKKQIGNKLSFENNGIVIGKGVSHILISGMTNAHAQNVGDFQTKVYINENEASSTYDSGTTMYWSTSVVPPVLCAVNEGDIVSLRFCIGQSGAIEFLGTTLLTVEVIE